MTVLQESNTGTKLESRNVTLEARLECLHQVFRPSINLSQEGVGDCKTCSYDPVENKKCAGYYEIPVRRFEIKDGRLQYL